MKDNSGPRQEKLTLGGGKAEHETGLLPSFHSRIRCQSSRWVGRKGNRIRLGRDKTSLFPSGSDRRERTVPSVLNGQSVLFYRYRHSYAPSLSLSLSLSLCPFFTSALPSRSRRGLSDWPATATGREKLAQPASRKKFCSVN